MSNSTVSELTSVPVKESLPPEHGRELLGDSLEELLDGGGVANKGSGHLETSGWNVANCNLDVIGDPLHEVGGVFVLDVKHLLIHLLHGHPAPEDGSHGEVSAVSGIAGRHHVLGVEHLLGQLGNCQSSTTFHILFGHHGDFHHHCTGAHLYLY